ncbi:hypothetical protein [Microvirga massiliensis]|uniref:hypothetical protein n=1 Tax=Microvirga massiliensis TaxID=1033741 RepID=UPI00062B8700|nr:hypothetical protein [Microvirga massiliensis]
MVRLLGALGLLAVFNVAMPALADEPGDVPRRSAVRSHQVVRDYVEFPRLVPDCREDWNSTLLRCAPREYVWADDDLATLNALNALPSRVRRPYPELFSW